MKGKENREGDRPKLPDAGYVLLDERSDRVNSLDVEADSCSGNSTSDEHVSIETASYAFCPRKMTPSMALEKALSSHAGRKQRPATTGIRPQTPATVKRVGTMTYESCQPRTSSGHTIAQYKLLQPIQPDSPPMPILPREAHSLTGAGVLAISKTQNFSGILARRESVFTTQTSLRKSVESDRQSTEASGSPLPSRSFASARLAHQVTVFQPSAYWTGRFSSLQDRLLNESFSVDARPVDADDVYKTRPSAGSGRGNGSCRSNSSSSISGAGDTELVQARAGRIFQLLEASCTTREAVRGLKIFQNRYARLNSIASLECAVPPTVLSPPPAPVPSTPSTTKAMKSPMPIMGIAGPYMPVMYGDEGGTRKPSFMDRLLMGRKVGRRSSGARTVDVSDESNGLIRP